ncbi:hypothetical protein ANN_22101 [Periplaneta americana]|uniref:Uncharacterized protein n=1 Tax=Periplaneta americana TaxID=6978 RepID=A0ABQ8S765_PERAM|nr:hypothetical protein ANN_22101 [Periplaneta americana]
MIGQLQRPPSARRTNTKPKEGQTDQRTKRKDKLEELETNIPPVGCDGNLHLEQQLSLRRLNINKSSIAPNTNGPQLREILRNRSFESWCKLPHNSKGVILYSECPKANSWMSSKANLSISEYINAIKMSSNLSAVRSVPGRSFNTIRCRHPCCNETETLGHVLRFSRKTELRRKNRQHKARTGIADVLKRRGWEVYEEIHCVSSLDSNRRADIVAIHRTQSKGLVLDPTIRFERGMPCWHNTLMRRRNLFMSPASLT